jgi:hypothetical protein
VAARDVANRLALALYQKPLVDCLGKAQVVFIREVTVHMPEIIGSDAAQDSNRIGSMVLHAKCMGVDIMLVSHTGATLIARTL